MHGVPRRHIVLVGLPGSGKTTAGRAAAESLGVPFVDLDAEVERRAGKPVSRIFGEGGESAFRALEESVGREVLSGPPAVVAAGGGFFQNPANRRAALERGMTVYLRVEPGTAAARLDRAGISGRPLLDVAEPAAKLAELLKRREKAYLSADHVVHTDGVPVDEVAVVVASLARDHGAW